MKKITIAKANIDGLIYYIAACNVLENELATTIKKAECDNDVTIDQFCGITIINNTEKFQSDLEKIVAKIISGEKKSYYQGDYDKYYLARFSKLKDVYELLEAKA